MGLGQTTAAPSSFVLVVGVSFHTVSPPIAAPSSSSQVVGVSFHVGSGAKNMSTYSGAIASARHIFDLAEMMGFHMVRNKV